MQARISADDHRFLPVRSHKLHVVDKGHGVPVVMVHGNPTWSILFEKLIGVLHQDFRCIAVDHLGCGLSDKPQDLDYSLKSRCEDLSRVIQQLLGKEKFHLVVHDWGGVIGFDYATKHPDQILSLTVCNTAAFKNPIGLKLPWQIALCRMPGIGHLLIQSPLNVFCYGTTQVAAARPLNSERRKAYRAPYNSWNNRRAIKAFIDAIPLYADDENMRIIENIERGLPQLAEHPMLLFWGERDFVFNREFRQRWQELFPKAASHILEDAGHLVLEEADETELQTIATFLKNSTNRVH